MTARLWLSVGERERGVGGVWERGHKKRAFQEWWYYERTVVSESALMLSLRAR